MAANNSSNNNCKRNNKQNKCKPNNPSKWRK